MIWILYVVIVVLCIVTIVVVNRRKRGSTQTTHYDAPVRLDLHDFFDKVTEVCVVAFTSSSCESCDNVWSKVAVVQSDKVSVANIEYEDDRGKILHAKYDIEAVPTIVVCDTAGTTKKAYLGSVTATDLWAGVAAVRGADIQECASH